MEHGWRWQRLTLGSAKLFAAVRWTGAHSMSLLCFAAVGWNPMPMWSFAFAISGALTIMVLASGTATARLIWTMSVIALFGSLTFPVVISVMVLVTRLIAISILVLSSMWFLFPFQAAHGMPAPCGAAVHSVGMTVRVAVREDRFLVLISHIGLPNTMWIKIGRWHAKCGRHNLPWLEDTSGRKSGRHPGTLVGFKTPQLLQFGHFLSYKQFQIPWQAGKNQTVAQKGPMVRNGTSSGNNPGPNYMPLGMRMQPPVVNFLSAGSQLGKDNSLLTTMLLVTMAYTWFKGSRGVILEGSLVFL